MSDGRVLADFEGVLDYVRVLLRIHFGRDYVAGDALLSIRHEQFLKTTRHDLLDTANNCRNEKTRSWKKRTNTDSIGPKEVSFMKSPGSGVSTIDTFVAPVLSASRVKAVSVRMPDRSADERVQPVDGIENE